MRRLARAAASHGRPHALRLWDDYREVAALGDAEAALRQAAQPGLKLSL